MAELDELGKSKGYYPKKVIIMLLRNKWVIYWIRKNDGVTPSCPFKPISRPIPIAITDNDDDDCTDGQHTRRRRASPPTTTPTARSHLPPLDDDRRCPKHGEAPPLPPFLLSLVLPHPQLPSRRSSYSSMSSVHSHSNPHTPRSSCGPQTPFSFPLGFSLGGGRRNQRRHEGEHRQLG